MPYQVYIALRYLMSKKRRRALSFSTAISMAGVSVGVMALLVVMAVMSGFHEDLQSKILGVSTHVVVMSMEGEILDHEAIEQRAMQNPEVLAASPFVLGQAMVSSEAGRAQGVYVRGVDPTLEGRTTEIARHMYEGSLANLLEPQADGLPGIILGSELSARLGAYRGEVIKVISPFGGIGPLGNMPRVKLFRVVGAFDVGMYEYDSNLVLTTIDAAREFFDIPEGVTGLQLKVRDIYRAGETALKLEEALGYPYQTKDWIRMNQSLFAALKLEKLAMFVILTLIVLVAAFNIVSTQSMHVIEKEREIAILKAMGATGGAIMAIFVIQGFLIGLTGTALGMAGGFVVCYLIDTYELIKLPADVYYLSHLPAKMRLMDFVLVSVSAVVISFMATVYPARQAARLDPVEPLRYE